MGVCVWVCSIYIRIRKLHTCMERLSMGINNCTSSLGSKSFYLTSLEIHHPLSRIEYKAKLSNILPLFMMSMSYSTTMCGIDKNDWLVADFQPICRWLDQYLNFATDSCQFYIDLSVLCNPLHRADWNNKLSHWHKNTSKSNKQTNIQKISLSFNSPMFGCLLLLTLLLPLLRIYQQIKWKWIGWPVAIVKKFSYQWNDSNG